MSYYWRFFLQWKTIDFSLTFLSLISTWLPHNTVGMFSHTHTRSLCQLGTFLSVNSRCYIKHYNGTLSLYIIAISQSTKLLLTSCIPYTELNWSSVGMEHKRMDLNTQGSHISNSPVRWHFMNVVFPVPPSPTKTSLNWTWGSHWAAISVLLPEVCLCPSD